MCDNNYASDKRYFRQKDPIVIVQANCEPKRNMYVKPLSNGRFLL